MVGKLSDERFALMSKTYEDEQAQLKVEIQTFSRKSRYRNDRLKIWRSSSSGYTNTRICRK